MQMDNLQWKDGVSLMGIMHSGIDSFVGGRVAVSVTVQ